MMEQEKMLKEAYKLADNDQDVPASNELVVAWLDTAIENLHKAAKLHRKWFRELGMGELDAKEGEYATIIATCGLYDLPDNGLHIYQGLEVLASAVGVTKLSKRDIGGGYVEYSFEYKGVTIYQLVEPKSTKRAKAVIDYAKRGDIND